MIAGLVSATMSDTSSRDGSVGRHATAVSATVRHHTSDASAGCAPRAHGEKPESGFAAPTATCAANATAVRTANVPRPGDLAAMAPRLPAGGEDHDADDRGDPAVRHVDRGRAEGRERAVVTERPRRARRARVGAAHVRAREQEDERADGRGQDQRRPRRAALARRERRPADLDREHGEHREQDLGVREMRRDPGVRQFKEDHDRAEHRLQDVEDARRDDEARARARWRDIARS